MERFRAELKARQGERRDVDFAALLGVSQGWWTRVKNGDRPVTLTVARAAVAIWPELEPLWLDDKRAELHANGTPNVRAKNGTAEWS